MLQRIQYSALSLASISILISGIVLVMTMTVTVYTNLESVVSHTLPRDFKVDFFSPSEASQVLPTYDHHSHPIENIYTYELNFDVEEGQKEKVNQLLTHLRDHPDSLNLSGMNFSSQTLIRQFLYTTYGGLIFIGIVVSAVLLGGMLLMLYFKQIEEGKADRGKFEVMKKCRLTPAPDKANHSQPVNLDLRFAGPSGFYP